MRAIVLSRNSDLSELSSLLHTLGYEIIKEYVQRRDTSHSASYFGPGKIDEIADEIKTEDPDIIVINDRLKPSQHHFLEMRFQKECVDRVGVILKIFAEHAHTPEAITQVQLARLRYEQPFLREWIHKAKIGERPGFLAGGAYATDVYYEHAKSHMRRYEQKLRDLSQMRDVKRRRRHDEGYILVSMAGYTNAGKSALMNRLCESNVEVSPKLFSSLSTTTRKIKGLKGQVLMIDTVGFIKDLPPDLIDAFKSTLEEIFFADLILFVFDASDEKTILEEKVRTAFDILLPKVGDRPIVAVGTKIDKIDTEKMNESREIVQRIMGPRELLFISSFTGTGVDDLRNRIRDTQGRNHVLRTKLPITDESYRLVSKLHHISDIQSEVMDDHIQLIIRCSEEDLQKISGWINGAGGSDTSPSPSNS